MDEKPLNVSVVGLGKLGCPLAACFAAKGHNVVGVDSNPLTTEMVNQGRSPIFEPGLQELMDGHHSRIRATGNTEEAVLASDVTFVVVPTPSEPGGNFSPKYVLKACESIGLGIRAKTGYHLVVVASTVMPGCIGDEVRQTLERVSGKSCGEDFGLCYGPTFVALGSVVRDFLNPDYLLIGESDARAGDLLEGLYRDICENEPVVARMNFINAEVTKLANNTFVSTKITFGNMLAQICERLCDANVDVVTSALGLDSRIGGRYLKGGLGYGGPCLDRDNVALAALAKDIGARALLAEATDRANRQEVVRLVALVKSTMGEGGVVGILGLSYKPQTDVVEASQGLLLAQALVEEGIPVVAYNPAAMDQAERILGESVGLLESAELCIKRSDVVVITTPWKQFEAIDPESFVPSGSRVLVDCWRILDGTRFSPVADYIPLGVGPTSGGKTK